MFCTKRDFLSTGIGPEIYALVTNEVVSALYQMRQGISWAIELIGSDQKLLMVINELLLNGAAKTFDVGIHLGSSGIGMPVSFVQASDLLIEVLHKLRAVIGKNGLKRVRKNIADDGKKLSGSQRRMAVRGSRCQTVGKRIRQRPDFLSVINLPQLSLVRPHTPPANKSITHAWHRIPRFESPAYYQRTSC
jgi:hypothetical protein